MSLNESKIAEIVSVEVYPRSRLGRTTNFLFHCTHCDAICSISLRETRICFLLRHNETEFVLVKECCSCGSSLEVKIRLRIQGIKSALS